MKAIRSIPLVSAAVAATMLLVSINCNADGKALGTCRSSLYANGVSTNAKIVYKDGYCFASDSCHKVADYLIKIPGLGTHTYDPSGKGYTPKNDIRPTSEEISTAKQEVGKACTECTSGGKPRCLKQSEPIW